MVLEKWHPLADLVSPVVITESKSLTKKKHDFWEDSCKKYFKSHEIDINIFIFLKTTFFLYLKMYLCVHTLITEEINIFLELSQSYNRLQSDIKNFIDNTCTQNKAAFWSQAS